MLYIPSSAADFTIYTLGIGTLSSEFSTFTILHISFHQVPITAGWTDAAYERLAKHLNTLQTASHMSQHSVLAVTLSTETVRLLQS